MQQIWGFLLIRFGIYRHGFLFKVNHQSLAVGFSRIYWGFRFWVIWGDGHWCTNGVSLLLRVLFSGRLVVVLGLGCWVLSIFYVYGIVHCIQYLFGGLLLING